MLVNKIGNVSNNIGFKGYQYEVDDIGRTKWRFNYPADYINKDVRLQFFAVAPNMRYANGYKVINPDTPIYEAKITNSDGILLDVQRELNLAENQPFAYRVLVDGKPYADTGVQIRRDGKWVNVYGDTNSGDYTLVSTRGTAPRVQGVGYIAMPDAINSAVRRKSIISDDKSDFTIDENAQKEIQEAPRTFSVAYGGNLAGMEKLAEELNPSVKIVYANPIAGGDDVSYNGYWNKNNNQLASRMGTIEDFNAFVRAMFRNGRKLVFDGTYTSEGLEGIHFQYAMRWADKNRFVKPDEYYWFNMEGMGKEEPITLGVVPLNDENLRHLDINPPYIYTEDENGKIKDIKVNPDYDSRKESWVQIYDASRVTPEQVQQNTKLITRYEKINVEDKLDINSYQDTVPLYKFKLTPDEYKQNLEDIKEAQKNEAIKVNSPKGTKMLLSTSRFKIGNYTSGVVGWDANNDMIKMRHGMSAYDEKMLKEIPDEDERNYERARYQKGAYQSASLAIQTGRYWTQMYRDAIRMYIARTVKDVKSYDDFERLISEGKLPKEAALTEKAFNNIKKGIYRFEVKGLLDKDDVTVKALMDLPLDSLEFAENTVGVLSSPYFSHRAINEEDEQLTRYEFMKKMQGHKPNQQPVISQAHETNYMAVDRLFQYDIKNFTDRVILELNEQNPEKLLDSNGNYTEFGEYVIELLGKVITKYTFIKALTGDKAPVEILPNGEITYDYNKIKELTSLEALGINAQTPEEEARKLRELIHKGLDKNLNEAHVKELTSALSKRIEGLTLNSFRFGEAIEEKAALGACHRLDAAKDVMDMDGVRAGEMSFDNTWSELIPFWSKFVQAVKEYNPSADIVAEITDVGDLMNATYGNCWGQEEELAAMGARFKNPDEATNQFLMESGITTEAGYSYFFTDLTNLFGRDFEYGWADGRNMDSLRGRLRALCATKSADYIRNLFSFSGNHDKPRIAHYMALDLGLFYADLSVYNGDGWIDLNNISNYDSRKRTISALAGVDKFEELPLEFKLNINNPNYFKTASPRAAAMSEVLMRAINTSAVGTADIEQIKYLKKALANLTDGKYLGNGIQTDRQVIKIDELKSISNAFDAVISFAKVHGLSLSESEINELKMAVIAKTNDEGFIKEYSIIGDFDWGEGVNGHIGSMNRDRIENLLRGSNQSVSSGEWDYCKYSMYTTNLALIIREAIRSKNPANVNGAILDGLKDFVKKYDRETVKAGSGELPLVESAKNAMRKNGFAANDIEDNIIMLFNEAEYLARKDGKLAEEEHFGKASEIMYGMYKSAIEPAVSKTRMLMTALTALPGNATWYYGDELGQTGGEEKAKNIYAKNRNAKKMLGLKDDIFGDLRKEMSSLSDKVMDIRTRYGIDALNSGTPYILSTSDDNNNLAYMMQDGQGNVALPIIMTPAVGKADNTTVSYVPNRALEYIELPDNLSVPSGTKFVNSDTDDDSEYVATTENGRCRIKKRQRFGETDKIEMNSRTAKNGVMILITAATAAAAMAKKIIR